MNLLDNYFAQDNTPAADSPVGVLMAKVLVKYPEYTFQDAREHAQRMLAEAAGRKVYKVSPVRSAAEVEAKSAATRAYFASKKVKKAALMPSQA